MDSKSFQTLQEADTINEHETAIRLALSRVMSSHKNIAVLADPPSLGVTVPNGRSPVMTAASSTSLGVNSTVSDHAASTATLPVPSRSNFLAVPPKRYCSAPGQLSPGSHCDIAPVLSNLNVIPTIMHIPHPAPSGSHPSYPGLRTISPAQGSAPGSQCIAVLDAVVPLPLPLPLPLPPDTVFEPTHPLPVRTDTVVLMDSNCETDV